MTEMFYMTATEALEFFERVKLLKADTEEERVKLLIQMINEGSKISIGHTERDKEQILKDYSKHGRVLYIKPKE